MRWPWSREPENLNRSIADPTLAALFTPGGFVDLAGVTVGEASTLSLSAMYRAVSLISGMLAALPMPTQRTKSDQTLETVASIFDDPDPEGQTAFEWKETMLANLVIHGRAYSLIVRNGAGSMVRLCVVHPVCVRTEEPSIDEYSRAERGEENVLPRGGLWHIVTLNDGGQAKLDAYDMFYIPAMSTDGKYPWGLINAARVSLGTTIAGDRAAANMFAKGAMISGLATPDGDEDITSDIPEIRRQLNRNVSGHENAGMIAIVNRRLKFQPWTMTAVDAQFLQSRQFQIEEISRWTGVPPHLLMQTEKQTSWGTGIEEQNRALGRTVLAPWATRFEHRASRLLASPRFVKFSFGDLERPSPQEELNMIVTKVVNGLLTINEARKMLNYPPLPGGDVTRGGPTEGAPGENNPPQVEGDPSE